jgi:transcriptional regulator with XRE-family HTH domain
MEIRRNIEIDYRRLRSIVKSSDSSMQQIARDASISRITLSRLINGKTVRYESFAAVCKALKQPETDFFKGNFPVSAP